MTPEPELEYCQVLLGRLKEASGDVELFKEIVNSPFHDRLLATQLDLGIVVLLQVNKRAGTIDRIALSDTELAANTQRISDKPFSAIKIPLDHQKNIIARAIRSGRPQHTVDWEYLFTPALTGESARFNQAAGGISCSYVYPLTGRDGGALIFSFYTPESSIGKKHTDFMDTYVRTVDSVL